MTALRVFVLALLIAAVPAVHATGGPPQDTFTGITRVVAFADVHGAYDELVALLAAASVIDASSKWAAGTAHVVSTGDLLDRGADSRKVLELLMRLQHEAAAAGGRLHLTLGNHEALNVLGDLRYVAADELAAYVADEPAGARERARKAFLARSAGDTAAFDQRFPPGYFGHQALFDAQGRYGRWLLSQPVVIRIDDTVFMHAGPSAVLDGLSLPEINRRYRAALDTYLAALRESMAAGLIAPEDEYAKRPEEADRRLAALAADDPRRAELAALAARFTAADRDPMLEPDGPNWYRGAALCNECSEADVLLPFLHRIGARRLVVGHTVTRNTAVTSRFDGVVVKLDTGMNRAVYKGRPAALLIEAGKVRAIYSGTGTAPGSIEAEPLFVGSGTIPDDDAAAVLGAGTVRITGPRAPNVLEVVVEHAGKSVPAVFLVLPEAARKRELAAYRLDRLLRLGLVPATAEREVQGQAGVLQLRPAKWVTQAEVTQQQIRTTGWCALPPQFEMMYAFDALIGNEARTAERIFYDSREWLLLLTAHERSFGTGRGLPAHLQARPPAPGPELRRRLQALDEPTLQAALDGLLTPREVKAVLERRDAVLAGAMRAVGSAAR